MGSCMKKKVVDVVDEPVVDVMKVVAVIAVEDVITAEVDAIESSRCRY